MGGYRIYLLPSNEPFDIFDENDTSIVEVAEKLRQEHDADGYDILTAYYNEDQEIIDTNDHLYSVMVR